MPMQRMTTSDALGIAYTVDDYTDPWTTAQTVVLLHSAMSSSRRLYTLVPHLARRYRVAYSVKTQPEYQVMHTSATFAFDEKGRARLVTLDTNDTAGLAEDVKRIIDGE